MLRIGSDPANASPFFGNGAAQVAAPASAGTAPTAVAAQATQPKHQPKESAVDEADLRAAVDRVNRAAQMRNTQIQFQVDSSTKRLITKIVDPNTKEVLRQIPNEEVLRISAAIAKGEATTPDDIPLVRAVA
jgi:flagellar protein FlaG